MMLILMLLFSYCLSPLLRRVLVLFFKSILIQRFSSIYQRVPSCRPCTSGQGYPKCLKVAIAPLSIINFIPIGLSRGFQVLTTCIRRKCLRNPKRVSFYKQMPVDLMFFFCEQFIPTFWMSSRNDLFPLIYR